MNESALYAQDGHVVTLKFNRPDTRNALTDLDMVEAFTEGCQGVEHRKH